MLGARAPTPARACGPSAAGRGLRGALAGLSLASPRPCALAGSLPVLGAAPRGGRAAAPGRGALHVCAGSREVGIGLMGNKARRRKSCRRGHGSSSGCVCRGSARGGALARGG